ncbi:hypothetical protein LTR53_001709 [Teratosphaeriaceae sp. CCFEE 6253]|nr:hypothetical protein LTR53_001709 [Teratosphaeriaceae sp. CCFEE 6253]
MSNMTSARCTPMEMRSHNMTIPLKPVQRQDSNINMSAGSSGTTGAYERRDSASDDQPLLEDDDLTLVKEMSITSPRLESSQQVVRRPMRWYQSSAWLVCSVVLLSWILLQKTIFASSCGYEEGFKTDVAYLQSSIRLHRTRFAGAIRATPDGNRMYVPEPALDRQGRPFTGPPSPEIDAAWHDMIYGRYVKFTDLEVNKLNGDKGVPPLLPLPVTHNTDTDYNLVPQTGFYGGPDMLHSLHCINGLRKHLDMNYYNASMPDLPEVYVRMHIDHCLEQLRQAVLCHGDMTPVTLKPVANEDGKAWALLGETEREHTCRNGEELARAWIGRAGHGERVESE